MSMTIQNKESSSSPSTKLTQNTHPSMAELTPPPPTTTTTTTTSQDPINIPPSQQQPWGTLEELLLASAVNRHGANSWDSVSKELNSNRQSSLFTPLLCRQKYTHLQHRFSALHGVDDGGDVAVWLDELKRLRVAELKRDLHRYDLSIVSLQLKVKRLAEERERSVVKEDEVVENRKDEIENSDLKRNGDLETFPPENGRLINESSNESNSTDLKTEPANEPDKSEPDRVVAPACRDDSCNGSSNSKESGPGEVERIEWAKRVYSGELGDSVAESRREEEEEGVKESSDVQSTASLRRREKDLKGIYGNSSSGDENQSLASMFSSGGGGGGGGEKGGRGMKSKGFVEFLDLIRVRKYGSVFDRRLESQDTPRYKSLIKEHIDLGIIQRRVDEGLYTNCNTMFYRDFMLLINNALVFFSKRSTEHKSATELRQLVNQHFQSHLNVKSCRTLTSAPPTDPSEPIKAEANHVDLKPKLAITGPVIASRKRSSIAGKLSVSEVTVKPAIVEVLKKEGEKSSSTSFNAVTKKRTRDQNPAPKNSTSKNQSNNNRNNRPSPTQKPSPRTVSNKGEISEGKKPSVGNSSSKSKQGSRPSKDLLLDVLDSATKRKIFANGSSSRNIRHKDQGSEKGKGREERESSRNKNTVRQPKKAAAVAPPGKRGKDGGRDLDSHAKKRQRR